jgi:hypothetical protein
MENDNKVPKILKELADTVGGEITYVSGLLSDGSGFATMSMPLRKDHWIYDRGPEKFNVPPMVFRMGARQKARLLIGSKLVTMDKEAFRQRIREAGKYAVRSATMNGEEMDFDPDALLQNLVIGFLGYFTESGLSEDEWANPKPIGSAPPAER